MGSGFDITLASDEILKKLASNGETENFSIKSESELIRIKYLQFVSMGYNKLKACNSDFYEKVLLTLKFSGSPFESIFFGIQTLTFEAKPVSFQKELFIQKDVIIFAPIN